MHKTGLTRAGWTNGWQEWQQAFWQRVTLGWRSYVVDTLLAMAGVALITAAVAVAHLYPRFSSSVLAYVLLVVVLASVRGNYAAILAALLASFSFNFFLAHTLGTLGPVELEDLLDPLVFLAIAIVTGQVTAVLRWHAERAKRREFEARLFSQRAQELATQRERQRLARELHDSISQIFYSINLGVQTAREAVESEPREAVAPLEYVIALTETGIVEMRSLIFELRPDFIASEGVAVALAKQADVLRVRYKLSVETQLYEEPPLSVEGKHELYCIAQEALHNVVKHACAQCVLLSLSRQDGEIILEVCDDGQGFDPDGPFSGHFGLQSIRERVALLGGSCIIKSAPTRGTHLRVHIPTPVVSGSAIAASEPQ